MDQISFVPPVVAEQAKPAPKVNESVAPAPQPAPQPAAEAQPTETELKNSSFSLLQLLAGKSTATIPVNGELQPATTTMLFHYGR